MLLKKVLTYIFPQNAEHTARYQHIGEAVDKKLPEAIQKNTDAIAATDVKLNMVVQQTEKFLNEIYDRQEVLEHAQEKMREEDQKDSFLMYKHGLSYDQLRESPRTPIYAVVDFFFREVLGTQPQDFPVNKVIVLGVDKTEQRGLLADQVGLLVITGRKGAWTAMVHHYALFERLQDWHARRQQTDRYYSIKDNLTFKAQQQDKKVSLK